MGSLNPYANASTPIAVASKRELESVGSLFQRVGVVMAEGGRPSFVLGMQQMFFLGA